MRLGYGSCVQHIQSAVRKSSQQRHCTSARRDITRTELWNFVLFIFFLFCVGWLFWQVVSPLAHHNSSISPYRLHVCSRWWQEWFQAVRNFCRWLMTSLIAQFLFAGGSVFRCGIPSVEAPVVWWRHVFIDKVCWRCGGQLEAGPKFATSHQTLFDKLVIPIEMLSTSLIKQQCTDIFTIKWFKWCKFRTTNQTIASKKLFILLSENHSTAAYNGTHISF